MEHMSLKLNLSQTSMFWNGKKPDEKRSTISVLCENSTVCAFMLNIQRKSVLRLTKCLDSMNRPLANILQPLSIVRNMLASEFWSSAKTTLSWWMVFIAQVTSNSADASNFSERLRKQRKLRETQKIMFVSNEFFNLIVDSFPPNTVGCISHNAHMIQWMHLMPRISISMNW